MTIDSGQPRFSSVVSDVAAILSPLTTLSDLASKFMALRLERRRLDNAEKADRRRHEEQKQLLRLQAAVLDDASRRAGAVDLQRVIAEHAVELRRLEADHDLGRRAIEQRATHAVASVQAYRDVELRRIEAARTVALAGLAAQRESADRFFRVVERRDGDARRAQHDVQRAMRQAQGLGRRPDQSLMAHELVGVLARALTDIVTRRAADDLFCYVLDPAPGGARR
ncbi:hypothetical protein [Blastococcus sp. TF02-8]|uniref:hypothetical protein n=1 Tax=Blastococcus sp. TF02-8 TaxID=2250574 RepID=UPI0011BF19C0|nr:hypothetical protein [Blastococcus sp. TF02-8]